MDAREPRRDLAPRKGRRVEEAEGDDVSGAISVGGRRCHSDEEHIERRLARGGASGGRGCHGEPGLSNTVELYRHMI